MKIKMVVLIVLSGLFCVPLSGWGQEDFRIKEWREKAEQGDDKFQYLLGRSYHTGDGVVRNREEGVKWYRKAAEQGHREAQFKLGRAYCTGEGVQQDYLEAAKWCRKAAEQGQTDAQLNLGIFYAAGKGVVQDLTEAVKWYQTAAEMGNPLAQLLYGGCYHEGVGVPINYARAYAWWDAAAAQGDLAAEKKRNALMEIMTPEQIAEGKSDIERIKWLVERNNTYWEEPSLTLDQVKIPEVTNEVESAESTE